MDKNKMLDLYKVLSVNSKHHPNEHLDQLYDEYFSMNWLRPETALYYFTMAKAMYKLLDYFEEPILDLGCGDGTFMSIFFGGMFDKTTDSYRTIDLSKKDIYDNYVPKIKTLLIKRPTGSVYGIDNRKNVVDNTRELGFYSGLLVGDARYTKFKNGTMGTVYCNMVNDIPDKDLPRLFHEVNRILKDSGYFIFTCPTDKFLSCLYYGKSIWKPKTLAFWKQLLKEHSFVYEISEPFMDKKLLQFWDTGFRPYFSELLEFVKKHKSIMPEFKKIWVEILKNYFFDYVDRPLEGDIGFVLMVARKVKNEKD